MFKAGGKGAFSPTLIPTPTPTLKNYKSATLTPTPTFPNPNSKPNSP